MLRQWFRELLFSREALRLKEIEVEVQKHAAERLYNDCSALMDANKDLREQLAKMNESVGNFDARMADVVGVMTQHHGLLNRLDELSVAIRGDIVTVHADINERFKAADESSDTIKGKIELLFRDMNRRFDLVRDDFTTFSEQKDVNDGISDLQISLDSLHIKIDDICLDNIHNAVMESTESIGNSIRRVEQEVGVLKKDAGTELAPTLDAISHRLKDIREDSTHIPKLFSWLREINRIVDVIHNKQTSESAPVQTILLGLFMKEHPSYQLTSKYIHENSGLTHNQIRHGLDKLVKHGKLIHVKRGVYELSDDYRPNPDFVDQVEHS